MPLSATERSRRFREKQKYEGIKRVEVYAPASRKDAILEAAKSPTKYRSKSAIEKAVEPAPKPRSQAAIEKAAYRAKKKAEGFARMDIMVKPDEALEVKAFLAAYRLRKQIAPSLAVLRQESNAGGFQFIPSVWYAPGEVIEEDEADYAPIVAAIQQHQQETAAQAQ